MKMSNSSFDWNSSPLTLEAAQNRAQRDAAVAAEQRRERSEELTRYERFGMSAAEVHHPGGFSDVRSACRRWLIARGMMQTKSSVQYADSLTQRVRNLLEAARTPMTARQVADALSLMSVADASKRLGHLVAVGEFRIVRRTAPFTYAFFTPPAGNSRKTANEPRTD